MLLELQNRDDEALLRAEIDAGLRAIADPGLNSSDHVCCGDMGRVEVLLHGYRILQDPHLRDSAQLLARRVIERAEARGCFHGMMDPSFFDPTFFTGAAGIGYTLTRLAGLEDLPFILAME
jgi:lantibiotic modifying enzyme